LIDWATLTERSVVKIANWHARINIITLLIFVASFYLRTSGGAAWIKGMPLLPIIVSAVGVVGLGIAGWLGGELVFRHGVAVAPRTTTEVRGQQSQSDIRAA
jgi:uncharacterized membrane protein